MLTWRTPSGPNLRHCVKVALAAVAAHVLTFGEGSESLFSVLGAALVVGGSVGENLNSSLNRVRGTVAGTFVGIGIAHTLGMSVWSLGLGIGLLTWLCLGLGWGIPAARVGIAMAIVMLITHTVDATHYGLARLLNTLIGVAIGFAVSRLVWPIRAQREIAEAVERALKATRAALEALARGAASDVLLPLQAQVFDALAAVRTARKNALLERRIERDAELMHSVTVAAARAGILALGVSLTHDELVNAGVRAECLHAVRHTIAALVQEPWDAAASGQGTGEFAARHAAALAEAEHPGLDADTRALLLGLLNELQRIRAALGTLREGAAS